MKPLRPALHFEAKQSGEQALLLHSAFVGVLWASGRLHPGGVHAAHSWREQMEADVAPLLPEGTPVWVRADNAYCGEPFAAFFRKRGWNYSVSVTNPSSKAPVLEQLQGLPESAWEEIGLCEEAVLVRHRPRGYSEHPCVAVRKLVKGTQGQLFPVRTIILVSRDSLPLAELVRRHRGKQGQENAFKGAAAGLGPAPSPAGQPTLPTPAANWRRCCCAPCSSACYPSPPAGTGCTPSSGTSSEPSPAWSGPPHGGVKVAMLEGRRVRKPTTFC